MYPPLKTAIYSNQNPDAGGIILFEITIIQRRLPSFTVTIITRGFTSEPLFSLKIQYN
jgi:hypothetical protein